MGRRKEQGSSERERATAPASPATSVSTVRATPELLFWPEDSEILGAEVWGGAVSEEARKLSLSNTINKGSSQSSPRIFESVPSTWHAPNTGLLNMLQNLQAKMDHLQNTLEDMPLKVAEIMKQSWLTKGQDCLKQRMSVQAVSPAMSRDCNRQIFPPPPLPGNAGEPGLCLQQLFTDGQLQQKNQCIQPVITGGQSQQKQCITPVISDGQVRHKRCIQASFGDWHCLQQNQTIESSFADAQRPEESQRTQPVFTDEQDPDQSIKLAPLCPGGKWLEGSHIWQQRFHKAQGLDPKYKKDAWCSDEQGPGEPSISLGSDTLPASETAFIDSLARRNENPKMPAFKSPGTACTRPALIERIKEETAEYFQGSAKQTLVNVEAELPVTDPRDLELKLPVSDLEEEVIIKEEEETAVGNSQGSGRLVLLGATTSYDNTKGCKKQCTAVATVKHVAPSMDSPKGFGEMLVLGANPYMEEEPILESHEGLGEGLSISTQQITQDNPSVRLCSGLVDESSCNVHQSMEEEQPFVRTLNSLDEELCNEGGLEDEPSVKAQHCPKKRRTMQKQGAAVALEEEGVKCSRLLKDLGQKPFLIPQILHLHPSHHTPLEKASGRDRQGSEQYARTSEEAESSDEGATRSEGRESIKYVEQLVIDYQDEATEEIKEEGPPIGDHKDIDANNWTEAEAGMSEDRRESSFVEIGSVLKTENLKTDLKQWDIQRKKSNPTEGGQGCSDKPVKESTESEKNNIPGTCAGCGESFTDIDPFQRHCQLTSHKCTYCEQDFIQCSQLLTHLKIHMKENVFTCNVCGKCFTKRSSLVIHERSHTLDRTYRCTGCDKSFSQMGNLQKHQWIDSGEKPHKCPECGKHFSHMANLKRPLVIHSGGRPYGCTECDKHFPRMSSLRVHQRTHSGEKPYECRECGKHFNHLSNLRIHEKIHSGEKPYGCTECGKHFTLVSQLRVHQRIHSGEKPYKCTECGKHFTQKVQLMRHERLHSCEKPQEGMD
ncbi:uncharacterized protein [Ambystoma mexicanum]|uniref:uncharacterized protein n=1 Tax=Ambystoma mexicanum TaxID=8296 RepID=UPI0037E8001E